jgi:hypothetical protein
MDSTIQSTQSRPKGLWWQPTLLDVVLAALLIWLFIFGAKGWGILLSDGDTGWHILTGEWILANRQVPFQDLFSFSKPGEPWFAWEWLADVIFALLHRAGGLALLTFFSGFLLLFTALQLLRYMIWRGVGPVVAFPVFLLSVGGSTMHYLARPHIFSLLFLIGVLWLLDVQRRRPSKAIWSLVPLALIWTNLHGAWPALLLLLSIQVAVRFYRRDPAYLTELAVLFASALATLCNPYGWNLHKHIFLYLQSDWIRNAVAEFQSPQFRSENTLQFEILLLGALGGAGLRLLRGWTGWIEASFVFLWAHLSLGSVRHAPILILAGAPVFAEEAYRFLNEAWANAKKSSVAGIFRALDADLKPRFQAVSIWALLFSVAIWATGQAFWPKDFPESIFPVAARSAIGERLRHERVFMSDQWGDYWLYHYWPETKVWMDGRSDFFGQELGEETLKVAKAEPGWESKLAAWNISHALLHQGSPLAVAMASAGWEVLYSDRVAVAFRKVSASPSTNGAFPGKSPTGTNGSLPVNRINRGEGPMEKIASDSRGGQ